MPVTRLTQKTMKPATAIRMTSGRAMPSSARCGCGSGGAAELSAGSRRGVSIGAAESSTSVTSAAAAARNLLPRFEEERQHGDRPGGVEDPGGTGLQQFHASPPSGLSGAASAPALIVGSQARSLDGSGACFLQSQRYGPGGAPASVGGLNSCRSSGEFA